MASQFHELLVDLGIPEKWNLPLKIPERDVQALSEDGFLIPAISPNDAAVVTEEKTKRASETSYRASGFRWRHVSRTPFVVPLPHYMHQAA